jgi:hypothetical protein
MHVASVSCGCYKSRSGYFIYCNSYTHMLEASVPNVSAVSDGCCTRFIWVLYMFHTYVASVSSGCCKYFHTYVVSVSSRCCICFAMATLVFSSCFRRMLQVFQLFRTYVAHVSLDVAKADLVLHMLQWTHLQQLHACYSYWACLHARGCGGDASGGCGKPCGRRLRWKRAWDTERARHRVARPFGR